ncbi:MAG: class II aldolase/adducin family protein [Gammaproteobacteria bacterium]|nr:class II aldolase/adducin family protein [Gammaproteobacteria bacterium]
MEEEGVIKFDLHFTESAPITVASLDDLIHWRGLLWEQGLVGQDPQRYGGYGFGNVSQRAPGLLQPDNNMTFIISGSQTGHLHMLTREHFAIVSSCDAYTNRVEAQGPIRPSSESLTHGMVYRQSDNINAVLHAHSPDIWQAAGALHLPVTNMEVEYGTPAMAQEVDRLFRETNVAQQKIFSMGGHEDGIVAFGNSAGEAGAILTHTLSQCHDQH